MIRYTKNGFIAIMLTVGILTSCSPRAVFLAGNYEIIAQDVTAYVDHQMVWVKKNQNTAILTYTGKSDSTMKFAYHEYLGIVDFPTESPEFYLDLEYDLEDKIVVYRDISVEVIEVTSDKIKFNILARTRRRSIIRRPYPSWI